MNYRVSRNKRLLVELTLIQLSQLTTDEKDNDDASAGRGPAQLKPIFGTASSAPTSLPNNSTQAAQTSPMSQPAQPSNTIQSSLQSQQSQQPPQPRQAQQVQAAPQAVSPQQPINKLPQRSRLGTVSIRAPHSSAQSAPIVDEATSPISQEETKTPTTDTDQPVSEEKLQMTWRKYASSLPREDIATAGRMNSMLPQLLTDGVTFSVDVANNLIESDLRKKKTAIETFIRNELHNSRITMKIVVSESASSERLLTPRQQFDEMAKENPEINLLMSTFDLDLI